jgi:hypothetical protein
MASVSGGAGRSEDVLMKESRGHPLGPQQMDIMARRGRRHRFGPGGHRGRGAACGCHAEAPFAPVIRAMLVGPLAGGHALGAVVRGSGILGVMMVCRKVTDVSTRNLPGGIDDLRRRRNPRIRDQEAQRKKRGHRSSECGFQSPEVGQHAMETRVNPRHGRGGRRNRKNKSPSGRCGPEGHVLVIGAEAEGLEPPKACARRISSAVPYQLDYASGHSGSSAGNPAPWCYGPTT